MNISFQEICNRGDNKQTIHDCEVLDRTARAIHPQSLVEIGTMHGTSAMVLGLVAKENRGHLWCIDPKPSNKWRDNIKYLDLQHNVTMIFGSSPWIDHTSIQKPIDYIFIDGCHETRWALVDYHYWFPFVRKGGRIAFHDIYGPPSGKVNLAIDIIKRTDIYPGKEKLKEIERVPAELANKRGGVLVFEKLI